MKLEDLKTLGLTDEQAKAVMELKGKAIQAVEQERDGLKIELERATASLTEASKTIDGFKGLKVEEIQKAADEWRQKYEAADADAKQHAYMRSVESYAAGIRFTSELARAAFVAGLADKKLPVVNGSLAGADEFLKATREKNPAAFEADSKPSGGIGFGNAAPPPANGGGSATASHNAQMNSIIRGVKSD